MSRTLLSKISGFLLSKRFPSSVEVGRWTRVGDDVEIGENVRLGPWSQVGDNCSIGEGTTFGKWACIGSNVTLGANVRLGSHTRVMNGVTVPPGAVFDDGDLVTRQGVIPNRTGGYSRVSTPDGIAVSAPFGRFLVPLHGDLGMSLVEKMVEDHQWGRSTMLEDFRVIPAPEPELDPESDEDLSPGMSM